MLQSYELTSPEPFVPRGNLNEGISITARRKNHSKKDYEYPGGVPLETWQKRLGMVPIEFINKTFKATTQYTTKIEAENRIIGRRHYKPDSPFSGRRESMMSFIQILSSHLCTAMMG